MKTLEEVLRTFPGRPILINVKSADPWESKQLVKYMKARGHPTDHRFWVWAESRAGDRLRELAPQATVIDRSRVKACTYCYLALGWSGRVPEICRGGAIGVPLNLRWAFRGWPNRFLQRMKDAQVQVMIAGPVGGEEPLVSQAEQLDMLPDHFDGFIVTDHIERVGGTAKRRWPTGSRQP